MERLRWVVLFFFLFPFFVFSDLAESRVSPKKSAGSKNFPSPPALRDMVDFWKKIFTRYSTSDVVFHDEENLALVYGTLRLDGEWRATRRQRNAIRAYKRRIESILISLSKGDAISSQDRLIADRILRQYKGQPAGALRKASYLVRAQPGLRERFREGIIRSGRYLPRFKNIFRSYGLPMELTLLPHVESGFSNAVVSSAGASGVWQFTRSTGRLFMSLNYAVDGRRDPFLSADAAARLLKRNYAVLKTWPLAITAYNHGTRGMERAVIHMGSRDIVKIVKKYDGRRFGFASRNFYGEFLAAMYVHKNSEKYFGRLKRQPSAEFDVFVLPKYIRLRTLSQKIGISEDEIRKRNPALRRPVIRGRRSVPRGYTLRFPVGYREKVREVFLRSSKAIASANSSSGRWVLIRRGDTLSHIARRHGSSVFRIMEINNLEGTRILPGERLFVPSTKISSNKLSKEPTSSLASSKKVKKINKVASREKSTGKINKKVDDFALKPSTSFESKNVPKIDLLLQEKKLLKSLRVLSSGKEDFGLAKVLEFETIGHYSDWLKVSPRILRRMNGFFQGREMRVGEKFKIPFRRVSIRDFTEKRKEFHGGIRVSYYRNYLVTRTVRHKLKPSENVWNIIRKSSKIPIFLIQRFNPGKDLHQVVAGDELVIPIVKRISY